VSRADWHSLKSLARALALDAQLLRQLAAETGAHYRPFVLTRGTKKRQIDNPDRALKFVQKHIRKRLLMILELPDHVHGCVRYRSPLSNASVHRGQPNVASIDITDFYPSVTAHDIFLLWRRLGFGPKLADVLTKLTTINGRLPQGAPTSDALANHRLGPLDVDLKAIADSMNLALSRYLDNIDLSGDSARDAIGLVVAAIRRHGFAVRHKKTFNAGPRTAHVVTGYTVNNEQRPTVAEHRKPRKSELLDRNIVWVQRGRLPNPWWLVLARIKALRCAPTCGSRP
jgi:retron-type reverse transcriptase